jgi:hypothetical protein
VLAYRDTYRDTFCHDKCHDRPNLDNLAEFACHDKCHDRLPFSIAKSGGRIASVFLMVLAMVQMKRQPLDCLFISMSLLLESNQRPADYKLAVLPLN